MITYNSLPFKSCARVQAFLNFRHFSQKKKKFIEEMQDQGSKKRYGTCLMPRLANTFTVPHLHFSYSLQLGTMTATVVVFIFREHS